MVNKALLSLGVMVFVLVNIPTTSNAQTDPKIRKTKTKFPSTTPQKSKDTVWFSKSYLIDWGVAASLASAGGLFYILFEPPKREWSPNDLSIQYPHKPDTVSEAAITLLASGIPLAIFGLSQIWLRSGHDFHHAALGLTETFAMTLFLTTLIKGFAGRLRPDWISRCQPDAQQKCTGDPTKLTKGRKSFPSGHTSFGFAGATFLSLYLYGKLRPFETGGHFWKFGMILAPMAAASILAVTRYTDNRHHWEDILVGSLIGIGSAYVGYYLNFRPRKSGAHQPVNRLQVQAAPILSAHSIGMAVHGTF